MLTLSLIQRQLARITDDLCNVFCKQMIKVQHSAEEKLDGYLSANQDKTDEIIRRFAQLDTVLKSDQPIEEQIASISQLVSARQDLCEFSRVHAEHGGKNESRFMWRHFKARRTQIFRILSKLTFVATSQDQNGIFKTYRALLGSDVLRAVRDMYYQKKRHREALDISILIRDVDSLSESLKKGEFCRPEHYFDYARLLMDEVRPGEAIELLLYMDKQGDKQYSDKTTWDELFITALIEDGKSDEAMEKSMAAFSFRCDTRFYRLYTKASGKGNDNIQSFLNIAEEKGLDPYICCASDIARFDLIDNCITATPKEELISSLAYLTNSFIRTLSSTLYKHGYALTAARLRRILAEDVIHQAKSEYYSYAASDMKKAIDYSEDLEESAQLPGTETYLRALYEKHKRKTSLWSAMAEKIQELSVGKDGISYERSQT